MSSSSVKENPKNLCWLNSLVAFLFINKEYIEITSLPQKDEKKDEESFFSSLSSKNKIKYVLKKTIFSSEKIQDTTANNSFLYYLIMSFINEKDVDSYGISETVDNNQNDPTDLYNMLLNNKIIKILKKNFFNIFSFPDFIIKTNNQKKQPKLYKNILNTSDSFIMFLTNKQFPEFKHYILVYKEKENPKKYYVYNDGIIIQKSLKDFFNEKDDENSASMVFQLNLFSLHLNL